MTTKTGKSSTAAASTAMGSQADYDHFLPAAMALPAAEVIPLRADVSLGLIEEKVPALLARAATTSNRKKGNAEKQAATKGKVDAVKAAQGTG